MDLGPLIDLPTGLLVALVALGVIVVVELAILVVGLVAWARTPDDRMPPPNKWVWLVLILFIQVLGTVIFLVLRRSSHPAVDPEPPAPSPQARRAARATADDTVDLLYGGPEDDK